MGDKDTIGSCNGATIKLHGALEWRGCIDNQCNGVTENLFLDLRIWMYDKSKVLMK